jgi:4-amino-4-deoxy-L-arabinose transferase-like glycosyltransferase
MGPAQFVDDLGRTTTLSSSIRARVNLILCDWCFMLILIMLVPLIYFPYALSNLPVASNVDERISLGILKHFHDGSLDPHFFMYPTLYYYLTYLLTASFPFSKVLFYGRLANLSFVGLTGAVTYAFCRRHLDSRAVGVVAALCVVSSTIITTSGSYLCTDALLAATTMASLYYLVEFFHHRGKRQWLIGMLLLGCAVGCKYTAFLLFIAYGMTEILANMWNRTSEEEEHDNLFTTRVSRRLLIVVLLAVAVVALVVAAWFPTTAALEFVARTRTNADLKPTLVYLGFFHHIRLLLVGMAVASVISAAVVARVQMVYECIAVKRLYFGLGIVILVSVLATPYSLITPGRFLYDLGALARANVIVVSNHAQWGSYLSWLIQNENLILLVLSGIGIIMVGRRKQSKLLVVAVYLLVSAYVIGSAHSGYARYLTPLLPILYCGAGAAFIGLWNRKVVGHIPWARVLAIALVVVASVQLGNKVIDAREQSKTEDACWKSYQVITSLAPRSILFAGEAPSVELELVGIQATQVSWAKLRERPLSAQLTCDQMLVFDKVHALEEHVKFQVDPTASTVLDEPSGHGQQILRRSDCVSSR